MSKRVSVGQAELGDRPHALYRFFDRSDVLLYVGITANLPGRMSQHRKGKPWWTLVDHISVDQFATRQEALDAEAESIKREKPLYNSQHNEMVVAPERPTEVPRLSPAEGGAGESRATAYAEGEIDLARALMANFDEVDLDRYVRLGAADAKRDGEPDRPESDYKLVRASLAAMTEIAEDVLRLDQVLCDIFALMPDDTMLACNKRALRLCEENLGDSWTAADHAVQVASQLAVVLASQNLRRRPPAELVDWMLCGRKMAAVDATDLQIEAKAEMYARSASRRLVLLPEMCHARTRYGAMCPKGAKYSYVVKDCPARSCASSRVCEGHYGLCHEHREGIKTGETQWSTGNVLDLASIVFEGEPGAEVPF